MPARKEFALGLCVVGVLAFALAPVGVAQEKPSALTALPPAHEELLRELSPETKPPEDYLFNSATLGFAARAKRGDKWVLIIDGKEGHAFDDLDLKLFSSDGAHLLYTAKSKKKWVMMVDNKPQGPEFDEIGASFWFSLGPDTWRLAYAAKRGEKWLMVVDGSEGPQFEEVGRPRFSPDGQHLAYWGKRAKNSHVMVVDGKESPKFDDIGGPVFSRDAQHIGYAAKRAKKWLMLVDGKEGPTFDGVRWPVFSADGQHLAYWGIHTRKVQDYHGSERTEKSYVMVVDGQPGPKFEEIPTSDISPGAEAAAILLGGLSGVYLSPQLFQRFGQASGTPVFSSDSQHLAFAAKRSKKWVMVADSQEGPEFERILTPPVFSLDSQHVAYLAWENGKFVAVVDSKKVAESDAPGYWTSSVARYFAEYMAFSPDSQRLACVVGWGGSAFAGGGTTKAKRRVIVDGQEGKVYNTFGITGLVFSSDSRHFVYAVDGGLKGNKSMVVIDGQEGKLYDNVIGVALPEGKNGGSQTVVAYVVREGRKFYRVTQPLP